MHNSKNTIPTQYSQHSKPSPNFTKILPKLSSENSQISTEKEKLIATLRAITAREFLQVEFDEARENNFFAWDQGLVGEGVILLPEVKTSFEKGFEREKNDEIVFSKKGAAEGVDGGFTSRNPKANSSPPPANHPSQSLSRLIHPLFQRGFSHRAASDLAACYILFHDKKIHLEMNVRTGLQTPSGAGFGASVEQKIFDEFEKIRVVVEVRNIYRGVVKNILGKVEEDVQEQTPSGASSDVSSAISLLLLPEFFSTELGKKTREKISDLKKNLSEKILTEIKKLAKITADQKAFAQAVARILEMLREEQEAQEKDGKKSEEKNQKSESDLNNFGAATSTGSGQEKVEAEEEENILQNEKESSVLDGVCNPVQTFSSKEMKMGTGLQTPSSASDDADQIQFKNPYKIFTSKFDEIIFPQKLIAKNELETLRDQLDLKLAKLSNISKKMSLKLKRKLLSKRNSFLEFDSSRGILDRKKLSRLVIDPMAEGIYVSNKNHDYQDTALTILLDNSGSMRGSPIVMSALACEIIAGILEKFSVKTEIIGFTTADWKGGKARKLWESSGRPKNPGRLNELRHIIYKHFNQSFKKAKINLGLMLKEGVLKENIDGEALLFARSRLMQQSEKRKILLVISDGTPVDDSTASANDSAKGSEILSDHLNHVINKIEKYSHGASKIEIVGIGIGHTTEEFYRNSITIKSLEELGDVMIEKISELF